MSDTSIPREQRQAERLAEALGLTVRALETERVYRNFRARVAIMRGDEVVKTCDGGVLSKERRSVRFAWDEARDALRGIARRELPESAANAAVVARRAREECIAARSRLSEARAALARAESDLVAAEAADAAALAAVHVEQNALPSARDQMVLVALYEVLT